MSVSATLVALALLSGPDMGPGTAPGAPASPPAAAPEEGPNEYAETIGGVLLGRGWEDASETGAAEVVALKIVIDSAHRVRPLAFRASAQISGSGVSAEVGGKLLAPPLGPVRGFAAACAGGALRDVGGMVTVSGAVGLDVRLGRWGVFMAEAEARYEAGLGADPDTAVDPGASPPTVAGFAVLAGVGIPF